MNARFHAPDADDAGALVSLPPDEAEHLTRVLRLKAGDPVRVFNGRGDEFDGVVEQMHRLDVRVRLGDRRESAREARVAVTLAQAVLKGDKMDAVVRDAVMMGVAAVQPIVSDRSEVTLSTIDRGRRRERWQRIAVSSAKQCGRAVVPSIATACAFETLASSLAESRGQHSGLMFVEPSAGDAHSLSDLGTLPPRDVTVLVGPEGGWTPQEVAHGAAVCRLISLRGRTLRADAMPTVALAALFTLWGEL